MEEREQDSPKSSHTYDHARTSNTLPTTMPGRLMHYLRQNIGQQHTYNLTRQLQVIVMICDIVIGSVE